MWGGWTCRHCGCELDKWGQEVSPDSETGNFQKQIEQSPPDFIKPFDEKGKTPLEKVFEENKKN